MPRNYSPINGQELGTAILNQLTKAIRQHPDLFGNHLTYRAFRFTVGVSIEFLDGRGEGASRILPSISMAQGDFAADLSDPLHSGKVWIGVGFSHPLSLAPDQARAELHLPTHELVAENGQMVEREVPPPPDPVLDSPDSPDSLDSLDSSRSGDGLNLNNSKQLTDNEIAELFETPPPAKTPSPQPPTSSTQTPQSQTPLDSHKAAQLAAQARGNPPAAVNNPFDKKAPVESRDIQNLRPRSPRPAE